MLRITANKSASGAAKYFDESLSKADYYATGEHTIGRWGGIAAERLGLQGSVAKEDFVALCNNVNPATGEKLNPRNSEDRKTGYDFTFSAPKSASIAYAITGDERIREAFETSVTETMQELEKDMRTQTGQGKEKQHTVTGNMVWAEFTHLTSRPVDGVPDCHLHTHCFALNTTWNEQTGRFQAGEFGSIKKDAPYYEAAFDARFASKMKSLGYSIERRGHSWELGGIGRETIQKFSRRTAEVEVQAQKEAAENGFITAKQKDKLGSRTRAQKRVGDSYEALRGEWASRLSKQESEGVMGAHQMTGEKKKEITAKEAMDNAVRHVFERKSACEEKQLLTEALKRGYGDVLPEGVKKVVEEGEGFHRRNIKGSDYVTTEEAVQDEKKMIRYVREGRGSLAPINPHYQPKSAFLNEEQKAAIHHALHSQDQVTVISGGAGTGKTTLMKEVQSGIEESGKQVFGFAPSAAASRGVMRDEGFQQADTLAQLLASKKLQEQTKGQVIWVDEAGLIGNKDMNRLLEIAKEQKARLLLTGDVKQHSSVAAGDSMRIIEEKSGIKVARVAVIQRQRNEDYRAVVKMISDDNIEGAVGKLDRIGGIVEIEDREKRLEALVSDYVQAVESKKSALVVSPVHQEANQVTGAIRERLKSSGVLQKEERVFEVHKNLNLSEEEKSSAHSYQKEDGRLAVEFQQNAKGFKKGERWQVAASDLPQIHAIAVANSKGEQEQLPLSCSDRFTVYRKENLPLAAGDRIRVTKGGTTMEGIRVNNGDLYTVKDFDKQGNIRLTNGRTLAKDFGHLAHGYVTTSHSSQGKTVDRVFIAQSEMSQPAGSRQQFYVSVSRGREMAKVYTDDKAALERSVLKDGKRMTASEIADMQKHQVERQAYQRSVKSQQKQKNTDAHAQRKDRYFD